MVTRLTYTVFVKFNKGDIRDIQWDMRDVTEPETDEQEKVLIENLVKSFGEKLVMLPFGMEDMVKESIKNTTGICFMNFLKSAK